MVCRVQICCFHLKITFQVPVMPSQIVEMMMSLDGATKTGQTAPRQVPSSTEDGVTDISLAFHHKEAEQQAREKLSLHCITCVCPIKSVSKLWRELLYMTNVFLRACCIAFRASDSVVGIEHWFSSGFCRSTAMRWTPPPTTTHADSVSWRGGHFLRVPSLPKK